MARPSPESYFQINSNGPRRELGRITKPDPHKLKVRRRIEELEENKRINQEYAL